MGVSIIPGDMFINIMFNVTVKTLVDQGVVLADTALAAPSSIKASKPTCRVNADAPAWRIVAGNIAAGATAGAVVEAGTPMDQLFVLVAVRAHAQHGCHV